MHRLGGVGIAGEDTLDRAKVLGGRGAGELQISGIRPEGRTIGSGEEDALGHVLEERLGGAAGPRFQRRAAADAQHAGGKGKQRGNAHGREHAQAQKDDGGGGRLREEGERRGGNYQRADQDGDQDEAAATGLNPAPPTGPILPHRC
jgi:hypothetical protein